MIFGLNITINIVQAIVPNGTKMLNKYREIAQQDRQTGN